MRITIEAADQNEEDSVTIRVKKMTNNIRRAISILESPDSLLVNLDNQKLLLPVEDIYYIESVDLKTYVYTDSIKYRCKLKLYEVEELMKDGDFLRISKQLIINITKIHSVSSIGGGRFEAVLLSGENVIVSRRYVPALKERFGL